jgi:translocation and assembly module TamB
MTFKRKRLWVALALVGLPLIALGIAWGQRVPIAQSLIDDTLKEKGVKARYEIKRIGTKLQRIEKIVIGDPANPDLTADWAEVDTSLRLFGADVKAVRAGGVRLRGTLVDGVLSLGAVDKLLPPPTGKPIKLPDMAVELSDAQMRLETAFGVVSGTLSGKGNLATRFDSQITLAAPQLTSGDCAATGGTLEGRLLINARKPSFRGPISLASGACGKNRLERAVVTLDGDLSEEFDQWSGKAVLSAERLNAPQASVRSVSGTVDFAGRIEQTSGNYALNAGSVAAPSITAGPTKLAGQFDARYGDTVGFALNSVGTADSRAVVPDEKLLAGLSGLRSSGSGTPLAPIAEIIAGAIEGLKRGGQAGARYTIEQVGSCCGNVTLSVINAASLSGAKLSFRGDEPMRYSWPSGLDLVGQLQISGGGFPTTSVSIKDDRGIAVVAPITAGSSRLALSPVRLTFHEGRRGLNSGFSVDTIATVDGPLGSGMVRGLQVPLGLSGGQVALGCLPVSFRSLALSGLNLTPGKVNVCVDRGTARLGATRLTGRMGANPISLAARSAIFGMAKGDFEVDALAVRLANGPEMTMLDVSKLSGSLNGGSATGRYSGASGRIGAVPLLLSEAAGQWAFARDVFTTKASLKIADAAPDYRFNPLFSNDFALRFVGGQITAGGSLIAPKSGTRISQVSMTHNLARSSGQAILDVPGLRFGQTLQPEELTPITLGVIANVQGNVTGRGVINWTPKGVTSSGTFRTDAMDMAAAFGPVAGLSGEISLSDLLGMETEPSQLVRIAAINPGIAVLDGEIRYRLLPGLKTQIEGGRWPFAGGVLILEPTVLDLNQAAERRLTFRVEGLDISRFIAAMEFENIAATGTFDGTLPMVFDANGGRIEGGRLIARSGGTVSYIGEISNENIGTMGRFAFDALKSIKYDRLSIDLEGAIDGDVVTRIKFAGVNQAPLTGVRAKLPIPIKITGLTNIPFIFNVTITAKFRQLFEMARSFNDPSVIINRMLPQLEPVPKEERKPVQPPESSPKL